MFKKFILGSITAIVILYNMIPASKTLEEMRDDGIITVEQYEERKERSEAKEIREKQAQFENDIKLIAKNKAVEIIKSRLKDPRSYEEEFFYFNFDERKMQIGFYATNGFGGSVWEGYEFDVVLGGERVVTPVYKNKIKR